MPAIGAEITTRSKPPFRSRSAFVGEWTPPSTYRAPPISTGAKNPGIADDAATALPSRTGPSISSRPNTTRRPSASRTATTHSGFDGHAAPPASSSTRSEIIAVSIVPGRQHPGEGDARPAD